MLTSHMVLGAGLGLIIAMHLLRTWQTTRLWAVVSIGAAAISGWFASRSFTPLMVAGHAAFAAYATVALAAPATAVSLTAGTGQPPGTWKTPVARLGFALLLLQIALGALLRHHLISVVWHLLTGGLAALAILVPAVATTQEPSAMRDERFAARWAIALVLVQVSLGIGVLLMILVGTPNAFIWLVTTASHVVAGSLTLLAAAALVRVLRTTRSTGDNATIRVAH
jgi:hypothetical protein